MRLNICVNRLSCFFRSSFLFRIVVALSEDEVFDFVEFFGLFALRTDDLAEAGFSDAVSDLTDFVFDDGFRDFVVGI